MVEYAIFDLYHIFVELIFGHFLVAIIGLVAIFAILCYLMKMSQFLTTTILFSFLLIMLVGYYGSIFGILMLLFSSLYFVIAIIRWISGYMA